MGGKKPGSVDKEIALRIKACRASKGLSQTELAAQLGVTFQQVQKYEQGINRIGAGRLFEMARVFGIPVQTFFPSAEKADANDSCDTLKISEFMLSTDGWRLCRAFLEIASPQTRKTIIALVQQLSDAEKARGGSEPKTH
jgi:transcriptional regulator with XRE-family HTH domain